MSNSMCSGTTDRHTASTWRLLRQAAGCPRSWPGKLGRFLAGIFTYVTWRGIDGRVRRLQELGHIEQVPTKVQMMVGGLDMVRFWISPAAGDYYEQQGINYSFHQLLRFLDEPLSLTDPLGFLSTRDAIIGHLMQVVHANPVYDLQLLDGFEDGLDQLCMQLEQMLDGTHPRAGSIGAIVEEPDYHERLLAFVRAWRVDRDTPPMKRGNVLEQEWSVLEHTFGTLTNSMRYFTRMPTGLFAGLRHLRTVKEFPAELAPAREREPNVALAA